MAFETSVSLKDCKYTYSLHPKVNIFKNPENDIIQQKFYFLMDSLVEREIFNKTEV